MSTLVKSQAIYIFLFLAIYSVNSQRTAEQILGEILDNSRYDDRTRPRANIDKPLDVYININVNDISEFNELKMEYSMTLYLRQVWKDERLDYTAQGYSKSITLNHRHFDRIWTPDLFIRNLKSGSLHTLTKPNKLIRLSPDGTILYSQRLTVVLHCGMDLRKYPMDNQTCMIEFGSYSYTSLDIVFHWRQDAMPVEINSGIILPQFIFKGVSNIVCAKVSNSTASFPCLRASFYLSRRLRTHIISTYLPSTCIVLLSWLPLWIDLDLASLRMPLNFLAIFLITTLSSGQREAMFGGLSMKALDVWMITCFVFVFGSFIQYMIVSSLHQHQKLRTAKDNKVGSATGTSMPEAIPMKDEHGEGSPPEAPTSRNEKPSLGSWWRQPGGKLCSSSAAYTIDAGARLIYPLAFLVFNIIYWPLYLH